MPGPKPPQSMMLGKERLPIEMQSVPENEARVKVAKAADLVLRMKDGVLTAE